MTARTSQLLADALRKAGFEHLAARAEADEFHDFLSPHATPTLKLVGALARLEKIHKPPRSKAAYFIRMRVQDGEFDADEKESAEWAESPEGQEAARKLFE